MGSESSPWPFCFFTGVLLGWLEPTFSSPEIWRQHVLGLFFRRSANFGVDWNPAFPNSWRITGQMAPVHPFPSIFGVCTFLSNSFPVLFDGFHNPFDRIRSLLCLSCFQPAIYFNRIFAAFSWSEFLFIIGSIHYPGSPLIPKDLFLRIFLCLFDFYADSSKYYRVFFRSWTHQGTAYSLILLLKTIF